jgi:hypothetical protein
VGARSAKIELDRQKDPIRLGSRLAQQDEIGAIEAAATGVAQGTGVSLSELPEPSCRRGVERTALEGKGRVLEQDVRRCCGVRNGHLRFRE